MRKSLPIVALALAVWPSTATAQRITGAIRGTVTDSTQAVVVGSKVTVVGEDTGLTRSTTTNSEGSYLFAELPVGSYRVEVAAAGFRAAVRTKVPLSVAETRAVDFELATGELAETVTVESNALQVQTLGGEV